VGLATSSVCFVVFAGAWIVLNRFRREYYESAVEGPFAAESPYWTVIHIQSYLVWPIIVSFWSAVVMLLFEFAHFIVVIFTRKTKAKHD
jgi:hypothetical protein